nr:hypothetical protein [uncultured Noviherbaspirillum sp.]
MHAASSSNRNNLFPAIPPTPVLAGPAAGTDTANSGVTIPAPAVILPAFRYSEASAKPYEDYYRNGMMPDDKWVQANIAWAYLKNKDAEGLVEFLRKGSITSLDLKARSLDCEAAGVLADVLKTDKTLRQICVVDNRLGVEGLQLICAAMEENSTLVSLELGHNEPEGAAHATAIAKMISHNKTLQTLDLQFLNIGSGIPMLADALSRNSTLTEVNLAFNDCGPTAAMALLDMLSNNTSIRKFGLAGSGIGGECSGKIVDMLAMNSTLRALDLAYNCLGSNGAIPVLNALEGNATLHTLDLTGNGLTDASATHIATLLRKNSTLSSLNFSANRLFVPSDTAGNEAIDLVIHGLEHNVSAMDVNVVRNHPIDQSIVGRPAMTGLAGMQQCAVDMERVGDLLQRNRTMDALAEKDAALCARLVPHHLLCLDEGKVLARAMIMASPGTAAHEQTMFQIQCSLNVLASGT